MNVLVTGANGFMGTNLVKKLVEEGFNVRALVLKGTNEKFLREQNCEVVYGDVTINEDLIEPLKKIDLVYHLAAIPSDAWTRKILKVNYEGTINVFNEALKQGIKRFIYMSSLVVHGFDNFNNADESTPIIKPKWYKRPYIKSKILTERFLQDNKEKIEIVIIRPGFTPFGPYDMLASKEMMDRISSGKSIPNVNKGKAKMCYSYVENLCDGLFLAGTKPEAVGEVYILADNNPPYITMKQFVDSICDGLKKPKSKLSLPYWLALPVVSLIDSLFRVFMRKTPPPLSTYLVKVAKYDLYFTSEKARKELGYESKVPFKDAIERTIDWFKKLED